MKNEKTKFLTTSAMIAAIYVVLTVAFAPFGFGEIQLRISEALTILPYFTPAAIPGLFVGCLIGNILGGAILPDIIFGSLATLLGAVGSYLLRKNKYLVPISPIVANALIVPFILKYAYQSPLSVPILMVTVGIGEILSCVVLGMFVLTILNKYRHVIFRSVTLP